jgi:flagellar basal-body rod modification protein FlgD
MFANAVNGVTTTYGINANNGDTLGKEDFLQLLVVQMQTQDPLDPVKNEDFIAQLAQFNSLEQMITLNDQIESLSSLQTLSSSSSMLGKIVEALDEDGNTLEGKVTEVRYVDGEVLLTLENGNSSNEVSFANIVKVRES